MSPPRKSSGWNPAVLTLKREEGSVCCVLHKQSATDWVVSGGEMAWAVASDTEIL